MRIDGSPPLQGAATKRDSRGVSSDRSFAESLGAETPSTPTAATAAVTSVENLFVLQEVADVTSGRRRAVKRGTALLDRLDDLRLALLAGTLPRAQLETLRQMARERLPVDDDPLLAELLAEIDLRVAVELAKLDRAG
jgi:hypothetical protein